MAILASAAGAGLSGNAARAQTPASDGAGAQIPASDGAGVQRPGDGDEAGAKTLWTELPAPRITRVLISGFEPFGEARINSSWEAVQAVARRARPDLSVVALRLPVEYDRAAALLVERAQTFRPHLIVAFGLAPGADFRLERAAHNRDSTFGPDHAGALRVNRAIVKDAAATLPTGLPLEELGAALTDAGLPWRFSDSAGGYVCNNLFFHLQHAAGLTPLCGFIHVPEPREDHGRGLPQARITAGVAALLCALIWQERSFDPRAPARFALDDLAVRIEAPGGGDDPPPDDRDPAREPAAGPTLTMAAGGAGAALRWAPPSADGNRPGAVREWGLSLAPGTEPVLAEPRPGREFALLRARPDRWTLVRARPAPGPGE